METRSRFKAAYESLTAAMAAFRPSSGRWSNAEQTANQQLRKQEHGNAEQRRGVGKQTFANRAGLAGGPEAAGPVQREPPR